MTTPDRTHSPSEVRTPFHGVVTLLVETGEAVEAGQVVAVLEAMKMEAPVTAPRAGTVVQTALDGSGTVAGGDLLLVIS